VDSQITANAADGSETIVNGGTDISVSGSGTSGDPYIVNSTFTEVDGSITNEVNTRFEVSGANLEIEDGNGTLQVPLANLGSDDQTLSEVLSEGNSAGTSITNVTDPTNAQDAATKNYVDSQITANAADGSETIVNAGTDISVSGSGTSGDPYIVNSTFTESQEAIDVPYDPSTTTLTSGNVQNVIEELKAEVDAFAATSGQTNTASNVGTGGVGTFARKTGVDLEFKNINAGSNKITITDDAANDEIDIDINEANLTITESQISDLNHTVDTDDQTLSEVLSEGNSAGTSITNVTDPTNAQDAATKNYVDSQITANAADGSETIVNAGTDISVSGSGTSGDPYVVNSTFTEVDGSVTNEVNTRFEVSGANLEIEDGNGTLQVPLANLGSDDQTLSEVLSEGNSAGTSITNVTDPTNAQDAATKNYVDSQITANAADGSETIVNAGTDISVSGSGTSGDPYVVNSTFVEVDGSITNEIQDLASVLGEGNSAGTSITNMTDPTNAQDAATKNYVDSQITANAADGSETIVNGGTDISVSGSGTSGDPYVVNSTFTEVDGSVTNEVNTRFEVSGANLEIEDGNGTLQVPLANLGSDDQTLSEVLSEGNSAGTSITNVTDPTNAQDAATKNYVDSQITANAADGSETIVNA
ncbi:beta strand repeat-containing protein, partial [Flagellimonas olearia]|uniref:beta strand repeat-containing protein n=1 Tax=Flagellimonas olearia TaxID=552546 RepID=UPI001478CFAA